MRTDDRAYTARLEATAWWKRLLDVQRPYRWYLRRLRLGFVLDVGCGVGRNLVNLGGRGAGVGVDHNPASVAAARRRGLVAYTPDELRAAPEGLPGRFDAMLLAHVAEHMREREALALALALALVLVLVLVRTYLDLVRTGGRIVVITPQEAGFAGDPTHVELMDFAAVERILRAAGCAVEARYSFPFPRPCGRVFKHNEFVVLGRKPSR